MKTLAFVPVERYLRTVYRPDREYVDGEIVERAMGERDHSELQRELLVFFHARRKEWNIQVFPEQRIQVKPTRFRVPDVCVYVGEKPGEQIFRTPPFLCMEVLSPEDRMDRMQQRIADYLEFGVPHVWAIDPVTRVAWAHTPDGVQEVRDTLRTKDPLFELPLSAVSS